MKLYFTRHGRTEWNQARRLQGMNGDSPLLPASYEEIAKLGSYLRDVPFEKIYASTSKRAQDTAKGVAAELTHPVEIISCDRLRELGLGELEGKSFDNLTGELALQMKNLRFHLDRYDPSIFGGEPIQEAIRRIRETVATAVEANEHGPLLFVGHGASMTAAIQWMSGKDLSELRDQGGLLNNSLSVMETQDTSSALPYELDSWNNISFL